MKMIALAVMVLAMSISACGEPTAAATCQRRTIAFSAVKPEAPGESNIFVMCEDGTGEQQLTENVSSNNRPIWSPDGTLIAFESLREEHFDILIMRPDGSDIINLTRIDSLAPFDNPHDEHATWSPDGRYIAFTSDRTGENDVYVVAVDGSELRQVASDSLPELYPSWSPDGSTIAYTAIDPDGGQLRIVNADGTDVRIVTEIPGYEQDPHWSRDGTLILFTRGEPLVDRPGRLPPDIWVVAADGSGLRNVTSDSREYDYDPAWGPDGNRIALVSHRAGGVHIFVVDLRTNVATNLTQRTGSYTGPTWRR